MQRLHEGKEGNMRSDGDSRCMVNDERRLRYERYEIECLGDTTHH